MSVDLNRFAQPGRCTVDRDQQADVEHSRGRIRAESTTVSTRKPNKRPQIHGPQPALSAEGQSLQLDSEAKTVSCKSRPTHDYELQEPALLMTMTGL